MVFHVLKLLFIDIWESMYEKFVWDVKLLSFQLAAILLPKMSRYLSDNCVHYRVIIYWLIILGISFKIILTRRSKSFLFPHSWSCIKCYKKCHTLPHLRTCSKFRWSIAFSSTSEGLARGSGTCHPQPQVKRKKSHVLQKKKQRYSTKHMYFFSGIKYVNEWLTYGNM